jgi:hypothetical protein
MVMEEFQIGAHNDMLMQGIFNLVGTFRFRYLVRRCFVF